MIHMIHKLHKPLSLDGEVDTLRESGRRLRRSTGPRRPAAILFGPLLGAYGAETRDGVEVHHPWGMSWMSWDWDGLGISWCLSDMNGLGGFHGLGFGGVISMGYETTFLGGHGTP